MSDNPLDDFEDWEIITYVRDNFNFEDVWDHYSLESWAEEHGLVDPDDLDPRDLNLARYGLTLGPDQTTVDAYHDDNNHEGAVTWCSDPYCSL